MFMGIYRRVRFIVYGIGALAKLLLTNTVIAQQGPPPWVPIPTTHPQMNYQPPRQAQHLDEFVPPGI